MSKLTTLPFTKEEMASELREILMIQASQISHLGRPEAASDFLKFECDLGPVSSPSVDEIERIDLQQFSAWHFLSTAYDYGFQVGQCWGYDASDNHNIVALAGGVTPEACYGDRSPFLEANSKCRHVVDLATGRWSLEANEGSELTVRQLALLAGMSEAAVRNSLSAEKMRTPVDPDAALTWLQGRKGFTPTQMEENQTAFWAAHTKSLLNSTRIGKSIRTILEDLELTVEGAAKKAGVPLKAICDLLEEKHSGDNLDDLKKIGAALNLDVPHFVGRAVEAALRRET